jgi:hypothetical protein
MIREKEQENGGYKQTEERMNEISPYLVPTMVALPFSCNAAANISAALAVPPLERMATGTIKERGREERQCKYEYGFA